MQWKCNFYEIKPSEQDGEVETAIQNSTQAEMVDFYHELSNAGNGWYMLHVCILMHEIHF